MVKQTHFARALGILRGDRGFSLAEAAVAVGVSGLVVLGTSQLMFDVSTQNANSEKHFWLNARRAEVSNLVKNENSWNDILTANPALKSCVVDGVGCTQGQAQPINIPLDGTTLQGGAANQGLSTQGTLCGDFNSETGSSACPIGVSAQWEPVCNDALCKQPQPKITLRFREKLPDQPLKDLKSFDLAVFRDARLETLNVTCASLGGTLSGTKCVLPVLETVCNPTNGEFVLGFDANGKVNCGKPSLNSCGPGEVAVGFESNGSVKCAPGC